MVNVFMATIGFIIFIFFGHKALVDFDYAPQLKLSTPFVEYVKKTEPKQTNPSNGSVDKQEATKTYKDLVRLTYRAPAINHEDKCDGVVCTGDYVILTENIDTVRIDSINCTEFKPESLNYDSGPYNPKTGEYEKIITNVDGKEIRKCGWIDLPKERILSRESILYTETKDKRLWNYNTYDEFGTIKVQ